MKRQSQVLLAVAIVAAGAAGCFKDPISSGLGTPASLAASQSSVTLQTGDSVSVIAYLKDKAGSGLAVTGAVWATVDPTVAVVDTLTDAQKDSTPVPGNAFTRAVIKAITATGGWTNVTVATRGITDTIRVFVIPKKFPATLLSVAGTALTDTVVVPANPIAGTAAKPVAYTAGDTLILNGTNGTSKLTFDTSQVSVSVSTAAGASPGLIVFKTPTQLKVVFENGSAGKVVVQHLLLAPGNASIGTFKVDTLVSDSVAIAPWRIGPAAFGGGAVLASGALTVTAGTGMSFGASTSAAFGALTGIVIGRTANSLTLLAPAAYTGPVTVYNVTMTADPSVGAITFDSLKSTNGNFTLAAAVLPGANVVFSPNNARLGDTVIVTAPAGMAFGATSRVILGNAAIAQSDTAWVLSQTAGTMKVFPKRGGSSNVKITNLGLASPPPGPIPFSLSTPAAVAIDSIASDFGSATTKATAHVITIPASGVDTTYGVAYCSGIGCQQADAGVTTNDFTTFTTTATDSIIATLGWWGTGNPYTASAYTSWDVGHQADLDVVLCNTAQACPISEANDLMGGAAATSSQPEHGFAAAQPAGQYWFNVIPFTGPRAVVYRLIITVH